MRGETELRRLRLAALQAQKGAARVEMAEATSGGDQARALVRFLVAAARLVDLTSVLREQRRRLPRQDR